MDSAEASFPTEPPERQQHGVWVFCVTTIEKADVIARVGFRDDVLGIFGYGVMVHLAPPVVQNENVTVVAVLLDDLDLEPYIDGERAYVPAGVLNRARRRVTRTDHRATGPT